MSIKFGSAEANVIAQENRNRRQVEQRLKEFYVGDSAAYINDKELDIEAAEEEIAELQENITQWEAELAHLRTLQN